MDWTIIISAATGLISGAIGSLIAPWVNWRIERVKLKTEYQRKRIAEWRQTIETARSFDEIRYTSTFADIRQYMSKPDVDSLFTAWVVSGGGNPEKLKLARLLMEVNKIEKKWNLI